ncbi:hypothetical protein P9869_26055 [Streptomyces ossamyceticus]|nr:hypothetical protein [Streptomyces ossamyceticus]
MPKPYGAGDVAARGGIAVLSLTRIENGGENVRVRGLLITSDGGKHWRKIVGGGVPWKEPATDPEWPRSLAVDGGRTWRRHKEGVAGDRRPLPVPAAVDARSVASGVRVRPKDS